MIIPRYRVTALCMGHLHVNTSSPIPVGAGQHIGTPIWSAALEGGGHRIVVDTGVSDTKWIEKSVTGYVRQADESVDAALAHLGWDPSSVDIVINTHLHYDHCGGNRLFPHARFYVSAREWEYAVAPIESQAPIYDQAWLQDSLNYFSYVLTHDHEEVLPGIRLILTPGHTPGHQSVLVNTDEGILAVAGDAVKIVEGGRPGEIPRILHDKDQAVGSIERIKRYADHVLAGHDSGVSKYQDHSFSFAR